MCIACAKVHTLSHVRRRRRQVWHDNGKIPFAQLVRKASVHVCRVVRKMPARGWNEDGGSGVASGETDDDDDDGGAIE